MEKTELYDKLLIDLNGRANVMTRQTHQGQLIVIYDDHRWLLNVLFAVNKHISRPNIIYFDAHDDAAPCGKKAELLKLIGVDNLNDATAKQFGAFVDYDQSTDDGGWLTTAMELNLIDNVVNIGNRHNSNISEMKGVYISEDGIRHSVFELSHNLEYELGVRGTLGDSTKYEEYKNLRSLFGIQSYYSDSHSMSLNQPFVLDFDLDFFTISCQDDTIHGWTERLLCNKFPINSKQDRFFRKLVNDAMLIAICREPDYCGSIGDSNRILELLDIYYFDRAIRTDVTL